MYMDGDASITNVPEYGTIYNFFNEHFGEVRGMLIGNEPWVVGKDIAKALGYKKERNAIEKHVDIEDKRLQTIYIANSLTPQIGASGQKREVVFINESGIYSLIFSSKLKSAKKFKRWVTKEVLPTIRATGTYVDPNHNLIRILCLNVRKHVTAAIARLIRYGKAHGKEFALAEEDIVYAKITSYANKICEIPTGQRNFVGTVNLINCVGVEAQIAAVIDYGIEKEFPYEKILDDCYKYASWYIREVKDSIATTTKKPIGIYLNETKDFITLVNKPKKLVLSLNGVKHDIPTTSLAG